MLNPNYRTICDAYHIGYDVAIEREELVAKVQAMLAAPGPYLLECAVKEEDNVMPMVSPGAAVDEMILEVSL